MCKARVEDFCGGFSIGGLLFMLLAAYAGVNVTVSINESWTTSTKIQFSLIEQHYAVLAKTNISDHHRQILQQQMHSLLHDPIDSCKQFAFARVLLTVDPEKSESA